MFRTFDGWAAAERSGSHVSTCEPLHEHLHVLGLRWEGGILEENVRRLCVLISKKLPTVSALGSGGCDVLMKATALL